LAFLLIRYYALFDPYDKKGALRPEIGVKLRDNYSPIPDLGWWRKGACRNAATRLRLSLTLPSKFTRRDKLSAI
jgi:hypothetical protein